MSSATKRKHVTRDVVENFTLPKDDESIVQVRLFGIFTKGMNE